MNERLRFYISISKNFIRIILIYIVAFALSIGALYYVANQKKVAVAENQKIHAQINSIEKEIDEKNMKLFEEKLNSNFSTLQLEKIAQKYLSYSLSINGQDAKTTNRVYSKTSNISIILKENCDKSANNLLPDNMIATGSLVDDNDSNALLKISSGSAKMSQTLEKVKNDKTMTYTFSGVKVGNIITIEVKPELAKKLQLENNIIEIFYNKESK